MVEKSIMTDSIQCTFNWRMENLLHTTD